MNKNKDKQQTEDNKNNGVHWLLWWLIDDDELNQQVEHYDKLKITQSARGLSLLFLCFSSLITILFIIFGDWGYSAFFDISFFLILGFLIYRGHKWAMIVAMFLWSYEKAIVLYDGFQRDSGPSYTLIFSNLLWWSTYMHVFYLAFKTERLRIKKDKKIEIKSDSKKEYTWTCDFCNKEFETKKEADEHERECKVNSENKDIYVWTCDYCDKEFDSKKESDEHEKMCVLNPKNKNEDKDIYCTKCGDKNSINANFCKKCGNKIIN